MVHYAVKCEGLVSVYVRLQSVLFASYCLNRNVEDMLHLWTEIFSRWAQCYSSSCFACILSTFAVACCHEVWVSTKLLLLMNFGDWVFGVKSRPLLGWPGRRLQLRSG